MIKIENIKKSYGKFNRKEEILKGINLSFDEKGFITILGKSGSGKTTLLNIIGGLDKGDGLITYDEKTLNKYNPKLIDLYRNKNIGYVFQNYLLLPDLTVYENIDIALSLSGINNKEERKKRIDLCLKAVNLDRYKRRVCSALSGGQQQRVAIGRALAKDSKVLICDEPTGNLDSINAKEVMEILKGISKHKLVIMVTHNELLANQYSDRIIRISDGTILSDTSNVGVVENSYSNIIDLSELKNEKIKIDNLTIESYSDDSNIKLTIVVYQGRLKIITEKDQKMIQDSQIIVENKDQVITQKDIDISFDDKYDNRKEKINIFKVLISSFKRAFNVKKSKKSLYIGFFALGIIISTLIYGSRITFYSYGNMKKEFMKNPYFENQIVLVQNIESDQTKDYFSRNEIYTILNDSNSSVVGLSPIKLSPFFSTYHYNNFPYGIGHEPKEISLYLAKLDVFKNNLGELIEGRYPSNDHEILISKAYAEEYLKQYLINSNIFKINDLLDTYFSFQMGYEPYQIVGIVDLESTIIFANSSDYVDLLNINRYLTNINYSNAIFHQSEIMTIEDYQNDYGELTYIKEFEYPDSEYLFDVYVSRGFYNYVKDCKFDIFSKEFRISKVFDEDKMFVLFESEQKLNGFYQLALQKIMFNSYIFNENYVSYQYISRIDSSKIVYVNNNDVKHGKLIVSKKMFNENNLDLGWGEIVGYYDDDSISQLSIFTTPETVQILYGLKDVNDFTYNFDLFVTNDITSTKKYFESMGLDTVYKIEYLNDDDLLNTIKDYTIVIIVIFVITSLILFLMNRSKMIKNIYTIGVFRSLGVEKKKIYRLYFIDALTVTTFTIAFGYSITYLLIVYFSNMLKTIKFDFIYFFVGLLMIYIISIISSLLPLILLLKKTPREITTKYDI